MTVAKIDALDPAISILCIYLGFCISLLVHELGHAAAAWAMRFRVLGIIVGGKPRWKVLKGNFTLEWGLIPSVGEVLAVPCPGRPWRLRWMIFILAGPLASALLAIGCYAWVQELHDAPMLSCLVGFTALHSAVMAVVNLVPFTFTGSNGQLSSDGLNLVRLLRKDKALAGNISSSFAMSQGTKLHRSGHRSTGNLWFVRGIRASEWKDQPHNRLLLAGLLSEQPKEFERVVQIYRELVKDPAFEKDYTAKCTIADGLASAVLFNGQRDLFGEAEQVLRDALQHSPDAITLEATLACLRFQQGDFESAKPILEKVYANNGSKIDRVITSAYLAVFAARNGRAADAAALAVEARQEVDSRAANRHLREMLESANLAA